MSNIKADTLSTLDGTKSITTDRIAQGVARAWVNFNGTGTVAIRASFNVSSITDNSSCNYTVNFATAMPDANYATAASMLSGLTGGVCFNSVLALSGIYSASAVGVFGVPGGDVGGYAGEAVNDSTIVTVAIFR